MRFMRLVRRTRIQKGQVDIAPLVDVVFLLLIFFMITSNFILQPGVRVELPKAVTSEVLGPENIVITISAHDLLFLNEEPSSIEAISERLKSGLPQGSGVLIKADTGSSLGRVVEIWDLCRRYGVQEVNLATTQKPETAL